VDKSQIIKTVTSSGTTGQAVSKIYLDRETSAAQTKALARITADFLGNKRHPMIVVDSSAVLKNRNMFSARGAGILGFSMLGRDVTYALDENMEINHGELDRFLSKHDGETILLFGFTFMVWEHFYKPLRQSGGFKVKNGVLIHGGGWKKLQGESVSPEYFKEAMRDTIGVNSVHNYYGMAEQTGSIFMECEQGRLHCSVFSDVIARRSGDFSECGIGETGLVQVLSLLPRSYPGHSILTEDVGCVTGADDCPCGRKGRTFRVDGRMRQAEVRGCGDTYEKR
jgi:phenylacetate-coenzyme A ligase PaaK-like adenylate-forming protein